MQGRVPQGSAEQAAGGIERQEGADRFGPRPSHGFEGAVHGHVRRDLHGRVVPFPAELVDLRLGQQRQLRDSPLRRFRDAGEHDGVVLQETADRRAIEQIGAVARQGTGPRRGLEQVEAEIEVGRPEVGLQRLQPHAGKIHRRDRALQELEHHLEERLPGEVALRGQLLDEDLEGKVLVGIGSQSRLADAFQQTWKPGISGEVRAQHQAVDEEADQTLDLRPLAVGDGRAHHDLLLPRVAVEQGLEGGEQDHEGSRAPAPGQAPQRSQPRFRQRQGDGRPPEALPGRPRAVGGEFEARNAGEPVPPVRQLPLAGLALEPLAMPDRVVRVLHGRRRQRRGPAGGESPVQGREVAEEHAHGPAVGDDVVQGRQQQTALRRQPQQGEPHQRPALQVEGSARLRQRQPLRLLFPGGRR